MLRKGLCAVVATMTIALAGTASAGPYSDELGKCFVRATSASDKTVLIQWIFAIMALNPQVKPLASVTDAQRDGYNRQMGALTLRLFTVDCRKEAIDAIRYEGSSVAFETSFRLLGVAATSGLMSDGVVSAHAGDFGKYIDQAQFNALLKDAAQPAGGNGGKSPR